MTYEDDKIRAIIICCVLTGLVLIIMLTPSVFPPLGGVDRTNELIIQYELELPNNATMADKVDTIKTVCEVYEPNNQKNCIYKLKQRVFNLSMQE